MLVIWIPECLRIEQLLSFNVSLSEIPDTLQHSPGDLQTPFHSVANQLSNSAFLHSASSWWALILVSGDQRSRNPPSQTTSPRCHPPKWRIIPSPPCAGYFLGVFTVRCNERNGWFFAKVIFWIALASLLECFILSLSDLITSDCYECLCVLRWLVSFSISESLHTIVQVFFSQLSSYINTRVHQTCQGLLLPCDGTVLVRPGCGNLLSWSGHVDMSSC